MASRGYKGKNNFLALFGVFFLSASLLVGLFLVSRPQQIQEQASTPKTCPGAEACPWGGGSGYAAGYLLENCHPPEADNSPQNSLCNQAGRVEPCGPDHINYCCPAANGVWSTTMTADCKASLATPTPTPSSSPTPTPTGACVNPNLNHNPWDVDQNGKVNIVDIGIIIDNYNF